MALTLDQYQDIFCVKNKLISPVVFYKLANDTNLSEQPIEELLIDQAYITDGQYLKLLSQYFNLESTNLDYKDIDTEVLTLVPQHIAEQELIMPFGNADGHFLIAITDPSNQQKIEQIKASVGQQVKLFVTTESRIRRALILYQGDPKDRIQQALSTLVETNQSSEPGNNDASSEAAQKFVESLVAEAYFLGASDIHIEPYQAGVRFRLRIDGKLNVMATAPAGLYSSVISRIKILADLELDKQNITQDGRFSQNVVGETINLRVSCLPSIWGQKVVLRLLPKEAAISNISEIGMMPSDIKVLQDYISRPYGMVLVTGPTNSGKTTTLYSVLREISLKKFGSVNISTVEDPVEYMLPGVTQVQVNEHLSFSDGLRELLRQDIDVLMVGEIRDSETADFAVRIALVGRQVFSTIHTNDAASAIPRLKDLNIESYLIASTLSLVIAQRLASKLCTKCRQPYRPDQTLVDQLEQEYDLKNVLEFLEHRGDLEGINLSDVNFYKAVGCPQCDQTGYSGRVCFFEILEVSKSIQDAIYKSADSDNLRQLARSEGMKSMADDAIAKLFKGDIDIEQLSIARP